MNKNREELFETSPIGRAVLTLAVPTVLSSVVTVLYSLADTYFVGMMNNPVQTAAVALAAPMLLAFNAVNNLFGVGSSSMISRALGRKDYKTVRESSSFGFYGAFFCGALFALLTTVFRGPLLALLGADSVTGIPTGGYLNWTVTVGAVPAILNVVMAYMIRSEGSALHASIGTMSGCLLNIVLDPVFILPWGLNMGAVGAALATCLSNCFALVYFLVYLFARRKTTCISISPKSLKLSREIITGVCSVGIPASIQNLLNVTGTTILNNFTASYGATALAAMGICQKVNMVPMYVAMGLSQGLMPLISYNYASGNRKRMKEALFFAEKLALSFLVTVTIIFYFSAGTLTRFFIEDAETVAYGTHFLRGFCLALPFLCVDFMAVGTFQAVGMGKESLFFAISRKVILEIPLLYLLNRFFPLYGLPFAQVIAEVILAVLSVFVLSRFLRKSGAIGHSS